jgi:peptide subunit release factor RF-3
VPRLRDFAMVTFVSKLDRDGCDPFYLSDEIERSLTLDSTRSQTHRGWRPDRRRVVAPLAASQPLR